MNGSNSGLSPARTATRERRQKREREIIAATRQLFDRSGSAEAQIEEIASAVGINRAILYRHFTGKEELFVLTVVTYLTELAARMDKASQLSEDPDTQVRDITIAYAQYGHEHPAFVDIALSLMRRTTEELLAEVSEQAMVRLGHAMAESLAIGTRVLARGNEVGAFKVADPALTANMLYASGLGSMQLARIGVLITRADDGAPIIGSVTPEQVSDHMVATALALAHHRHPE